MSDEDDWFTRAVRGAEEDEEDDDGDDRPAESDEAAGESGDAATDGERDTGGFGDGFEDFATAFENAPTPGGDLEGDEEFAVEGFDDDGFGGGFGDEEFDSDIDRVNVGIEGLDEMVLGGIPERSLIAAVGGAGTGKTTFGLQFVTHGLERGERCVYITLEETRSRIVDTAEEKGWELSTYVADGDLAVVDIDPIEMANSLGSITADLSALVEEFDASRLVLDSVSLLEMMYDEPSRRRSEVFEFSQALKSAGVTTMVTSEASAESAYTSRYGIIEYLADAVFVLQYVRPSDFQETRLALEIQKIRNANHSRETKPYEITGDGISVYRQANIF
ncbi:MAG: KaiC domain protein, AF_0351 family [uncultured archaeon A07HB70]|nr:MAG: KaiC domain protein, AF_0351 family [uncultured archaeon A07HB70]